MLTSLLGSLRGSAAVSGEASISLQMDAIHLFLNLVSRQIGLSKTELYRLVDCPMDGEKLKSLLVERGNVRL
jgi:hypothetical protein